MSELFVQPWVRGAEISDFASLNARLAELEFVLREVLLRTGLGPVPGSYFPLLIHRPGPVSTGVNRWALTMPVECRPVAVVVGVASGGEVTVDVNADGSSILAAPAVTSSGHAVLRARTDFSIAKVGAGTVLSYDIDSVTGAPVDFSLLLMAKQLGKIEQT